MNRLTALGLIGLGACSALLCSACVVTNRVEAPAADSPAANSPTADSLEKRNTAVVLAFTDMVFNQHEVAAAFDKYVGPVYIQHNPVVPDGIEGGVKGLTFLTHTKYPELMQEVKRTVAEGNLVMIHTQQLRNAEERASNRGLALMDIFRVENGRIVEHWDVVEEVPEKANNNNTMF